MQNEVWQALQAEGQQRDDTILDLRPGSFYYLLASSLDGRKQINASNKKIDLLEQQKKLYMQEFLKKVGKPCGMLLEQLKRTSQ